MATARIFRNPGLGSSALQKHRAGWVVEWASDRAPHADPLTGWTGGSEAQAYVQMRFPSKEAAKGYCERQGFSFTVQDEPPRKLLLQSYANNFR
jgi:hypothetical protein